MRRLTRSLLRSRPTPRCRATTTFTKASWPRPTVPSIAKTASISCAATQTSMAVRGQTRFFVSAEGVEEAGGTRDPKALLTAADDDDIMPIPTTTQHNSQAEKTLVFQNAWKKLIEKYGEENLTFPKDIMWLAGAPGSGKGHMTPFILESRGLVNKPVEVSKLLTSPEAEALKAKGKLIDDQTVVELLFEKLLKPEFRTGVIVDGFPRTSIQAECISLLFDSMRALRRKYEGTNQFDKFPRPTFHITVLYVTEAESVKRQMKRGQEILAHNKMVTQTGVGKEIEPRPTDLDENLARERYLHFKSQVYESLQLIKNKFHFHFINAEGTVEDVQKRILAELEYQSAMELRPDTFEMVRMFPLATEIIQNARYELVKRLDHYQARHPKLFSEVVNVLKTEFLGILRRQALAGKAIIRSENPVFDQTMALGMALDILAERGFAVSLDYKKQFRPDTVDLVTGAIITTPKRVYEFQIEFERPQIRHQIRN